jgi:NitT/TauT family transport system permease protein
MATASNLVVGGASGVACGLGTGLLLAYFNRLRWIAEPYLVIFQSFPREALFPVIVVWLGFGDLPKIVNAALLRSFQWQL